MFEQLEEVLTMLYLCVDGNNTKSTLLQGDSKFNRAVYRRNCSLSEVFIMVHL